MPSLGDLVLNFSANTENLTSGISQAKTSFSAMDEVARLSAQNMAAALGRPVQSTTDLALAMQHASSSIESSVSGADESILSLGSVAEEAGARTRSAFSGITSAIGGIGEHITSTAGSFIGHVGSMIGGVLDFGSKLGQTVFGLQGLYNGVTSLGSAFLSGNASMEQTDVAFETLLGKGKATQDFLKQLQNFAAATPFEFPELATDAQHMLAFGFSAKEIIPDLTNIGDAMGSMGKSNADIDHIVEIFGQMHAAGKLNAGDMMQLSDEGIPAWKMLADAMGKTVPEVQKLTTQGLIPADTAIKAVSDGMHKMFGGGMAAQAQTFNGLLSTFQDNISAAWRAFTGPLFDAAKQGLTQLGNLVSSKQFQEFATTLGKDVGGALASVAQWITHLNFSGLVSAFQKIIPYVVEFATTVGGKLLSGIAGLAGPFGHLFNSISGIVGPMGSAADKSRLFHTVIGLLGDVISKILGGIGKLADGLANVITWFQKGGAPAEVLKDLLIGIGAALAAIQIGAFIATIPALVGGFIAWAISAGAAAIATLAATWPILLIIGVIALLVVGIILLVTHWGQVTKFLQDTWQRFTSWFIGALGGVRDFFVGIWNGIIGWITGKWNELTTTAQMYWMVLYLTIQQKIQQVQSFIRGIIPSIVSFIGQKWNELVSTIQSFGGRILDAIEWPFKQAWNFITGLFGNIGSFIHNAIANSPIGGFAHQLHIPGFASGVENFGGGLAKVHKDEMVYLPSGSNVYTAAQTAQMLTGPSSFSPLMAGSGDIHVHNHIYLDGKEITGQVMTRAMKEIRRQGVRAA